MTDALRKIAGFCRDCEDWDGPLGWSDPQGRRYGKCCYWTINPVPTNPGFRDTPEDGYCYRFKERSDD